MMNIRNAVLLPDGRINCDYLHPQYGWIPFTADAADPEAHGREIHAAALATNPPAAPEVQAPEVQAPDPVPQVVSRFQARAALHAAGLLSSVEDAIATGADVFTQIAWADAVEFRRNSPTIATLAASIGLTETQIDDLFRQAAQITA